MQKVVEPSILAIVPARGGSKGIPLKNLRVVAGKTLLDRTLELALDIKEISHICVSTDHPKIKRSAEKFERVQVVDRPTELSGDRVSDTPVLQHALRIMEAKQGINFDTVVMLQVTSPLRTVPDVTESIRELRETRSDAVWTVSASELHYHPLKQLVVDDERYFDYYDPAGSKIVARQELKPLFHRNGSCYAFSRDFLVRADSLFSPNSSRAVISRGVRVNIDTETDLKTAEELLNKRSEVG
tara:strand:+ start:1752 stop:2477 length:726 start_codon:yes stop_codon:yes gene_type:complete